MSRLDELRVKIFADCADLTQLRSFADNPLIKGATTNPSLIRKAGVTDYQGFCREAARIIAPHPISFEVFADDLEGMERQARVIAGWASNAVVKIPATNTAGDATNEVVEKLETDGIRVNVTALFSVKKAYSFSNGGYPSASYVSIFAGRIADTGVDPVTVIAQLIGGDSSVIWASPREVYNVWQADACGCNIITLPPDLIAKLSLADKSLEEFSLETILMFFNDAKAAGYVI